MEYAWSAAKDVWLLAERGISFGDLVAAIEAGGLLAELAHPDPKRSHQRVLWIGYMGKVWLVPYVMEGDKRFLKTAFPSRQVARKIGYGGPDEKDQVVG